MSVELQARHSTRTFSVIVRSNLSNVKTDRPLLEISIRFLMNQEGMEVRVSMIKLLDLVRNFLFHIRMHLRISQRLVDLLVIYLTL